MAGYRQAECLEASSPQGRSQEESRRCLLHFQHLMNSALSHEPRLAIDAVLGLLDRELWIVTAAHGGQRSGLVATWISPASIDPQRPMLLAALAPNHCTAQLVLKSGWLAAHLLRRDQVELAWNFARDSGRQRDKLAGLPLRDERLPPPVLADCLGWLVCRAVACCDLYDRWLIWGAVVQGSMSGQSEGSAKRSAEGPDGGPLREQEFFRQLDPVRRRHLARRRMADVWALRPGAVAWRRDLASGQLPPPQPVQGVSSSLLRDRKPELQ